MYLDFGERLAPHASAALRSPKAVVAVEANMTIVNSWRIVTLLQAGRRYLFVHAPKADTVTSAVDITKDAISVLSLMSNCHPNSPSTPWSISWSCVFITASILSVRE